MRYWLFPEHGAAYPDDAVSDEGKANARPVAVIDYEDAEQVKRLYALFFKDMDELTLDNLHSEWARDSQRKSLAAALREFATPTPPKPEEPTGLGAVVETAGGERWLHAYCDEGRKQWIDKEGRIADYDEIPAVRKLSDGVPS